MTTAATEAKARPLTREERAGDVAVSLGRAADVMGWTYDRILLLAKGGRIRAYRPPGGQLSPCRPTRTPPAHVLFFSARRLMEIGPLPVYNALIGGSS